MRQLRIFQKMVDRGLIYRQHRPVHYSPSSRSALAESELEYKTDHVSHSVIVGFDLVPSTKEAYEEFKKYGLTTKLLAWTTTPWTLTANMVRTTSCQSIYELTHSQGLAINPDMRYTGMMSYKTNTVYIFSEEQREAMEALLSSLDLDPVDASGAEAEAAGEKRGDTGMYNDFLAANVSLWAYLNTVRAAAARDVRWLSSDIQ